LTPRKYSIAAEIRKQISTGVHRPGQALPPLPELCRTHQAASGTVRAALALLEADALIVTVQGAGSYVRVPGMLPASAQLAIDVLRGRIASGELAPGGRLPSHTELAVQFAISQATAKMVIRALREAGVVMSRDGIGVFVSPTRPEHAAENAA
jgi:DNA-binding GntR family transcriptional regulator